MKRVSLLFSIAIPVFALIALFKIFAFPVHAIEVWGFISSDTIWTLENSPYIVDEIYIDSGATLTIEAGVEVYAKYPVSSINIGGHLVVGSEVGPTTIISGLNTINFGPLIYDPDGSDGSGVINNTAIIGDGGSSYGIEIVGNSNNLVSIKNSVIQNQAIPIQAYVENLHRLQMENVSFIDNVSNQVFISYDRDTPILNGNVILRGHPGLESYEFTSDGTDMYVPSGITLTLEAGAIITGEYGIAVGGYFAANGTDMSPVTIRGRHRLTFYNSADLHHTIMIGNDNNFGIQIRGDSNNLVSIRDSVFKNYRKYPISTYPSSIHRLQMENVSFVSDTENWVHIKSGESFTKNVTLVPYPGLAGYEISDLSAGGLFWTYIPSGITFTLESGVTLLADTILEFKGHFIANGSVATPTIITGTRAIDFAESGSADIIHTVIGSDEVDSGSIKIKGNSNNLISIKDSIMQGLYHPIVTYDNSLHRLQMDNVSFVNNVHNRVFITFSDVSQDVVLTPQPGLEGYEIRDNLWFDGSPAPSAFVVPDGNTLTLEDGASLFSMGNKTIEVNGRFIANGTQFNPVNITSSNDSAPGEWGGISVNGGEVILNHTNLRNGEVNLALTSPTSTVTISNSTVISASQSGISVTGGLLNMECSVLSENGLAGLWVGSGGTPDVTINRTDIWGNGSAGITNTNSTFIDARYNWWGASDGPSGDFSGSGDPAFGNILHSPWLSTPNDCAEPPFHLFLPMILAPDD